MLLAAMVAFPAAATAEFDLAAFEAAHQRCDQQAMAKVLSGHAASGPQAAAAAARLDLLQGNSEAAVERLEAALDRYPNDAALHYAQAQALVQRIDEVSVFGKLGAARAARTAFEAAARLQPEEPTYLAAVAEYYRQAPGIAGGDLDESRVWAQRMAQLAPQHGQLLLAKLALDEGENEVDARKRIVALADTGFVEAQLTLAMLLVVEDRLEAAMDIYRSILAQNPDHLLALYGLGRNAAVSGTALAEGRAALERFLSQPSSACHAQNLKPTHAYWRLGNILARQGEAAAARRAFEQALALDPDNKEAQKDLQAL